MLAALRRFLKAKGLEVPEGSYAAGTLHWPPFFWFGELFLLFFFIWRVVFFCVLNICEEFVCFMFDANLFSPMKLKGFKLVCS